MLKSQTLKTIPILQLAFVTLYAPFDVMLDEGYGYYLTLAAEDLDDPVIAAFRSWIIGHFAGRFGSRDGARAPRSVAADTPERAIDKVGAG